METTSVIPASAIGSMLEGYCGEFVTLAASLAQTLEQASMRKASLEGNRDSLRRVERGMRDLADAIGSMLAQPAVREQPTMRPPSGVGRAAAIPKAPPAESASSDTKGEPADGDGNCIIQGSTDSLPLASVFQFLSRTHKTGVLRVTAGQETLSFRFAGGKVESSTTDRPQRRDRLGDILVELGYAGWSDIESHARPGRPLGESLVGAGVLTNDRLTEGLRLQMQRRFDRIAAAKPATYAFHEESSQKDHGRVSVKASDLRLASRRPSAAR